MPDGFPKTDADRPCVISTTIFDRAANAGLEAAYYHRPQWHRMVFVLNFHEHGGFFDHVAPPRCPDDTVQSGNGPFPDLERFTFRRSPWG